MTPLRFHLAAISTNRPAPAGQHCSTNGLSSPLSVPLPGIVASADDSLTMITREPQFEGCSSWVIGFLGLRPAEIAVGHGEIRSWPWRPAEYRPGTRPVGREVVSPG
jgi:hypothetical protein